MKTLPVGLSFIFLLACQSTIAQTCSTAADTDCNGIVNITELTGYIDTWYSCSACAPDLLGAISAYYHPPAPAIPIDCIAYWKLDGDAHDERGRNNGTVSAGVTFVPGKQGDAAQFNGSGTVIDFGDVNDVDGLQAMSVSLWLRSNENQNVLGTDSILTKMGNGVDTLSIGWDQSDYIYFDVTSTVSGDVARTSPITDLTSWEHIVAIYDGTILRIYVNGALDSPVTGSWTAPMPGTAHPLVLGSTWNGLIDEVMIFNRSLTEEEITEIYAAQGGECSNDTGCPLPGGHCDGNVPYICSAGADGCLLRQNQTPCGSGVTCIGGACVPDACSGIGACGDYSDASNCTNDFCGVGVNCEWDAGSGTCSEGFTGVCGDGTCSPGENCPADAGGCPDNACQEPACLNGCGQSAVSTGGNDEACLAPLFCSGSGACVECLNGGDCGSGESCLGGYCVPPVCSEDDDCAHRGPGFVCNTTNGQCEWVPPTGIPKPDFGIEETYRMYDNPASRNPGLTYTNNSEGGFFTHYVDNSGSCTDGGNNGTAANPRCYIPPSLPEASVVEIHNGASVGLQVFSYGTKARPVFIRSLALGGSLMTQSIVIRGNYSIWENLNLSSANFQARPRDGGVAPRFVSIRNSESSGTGSANSPAGVAIYEGANDIVVYGDRIHDGGNMSPSIENDVHGVANPYDTSNVWIVDNVIYHMGGDSVQVGAAGKQDPNRVNNTYIGRNVFYDDGENCVDVKAANHVIVSQNDMHGGIVSVGDPTGSVVVTHDGPRNVWIIFNRIYDSHGGIDFESDGNAIGNIIYDMREVPAESHAETSPWRSGYGIFAGGAGTITHNTISDVEMGIGVPYTSRVIVNNIISDLHDQSGTRQGIAISQSGNVVQNNLFDVTGQDFFTDAPAHDFSLLPGTEAVDNGTYNSVYQTFHDSYGISILKDINGRARPQGPGWDIGAYEFGG